MIAHQVVRRCALTFLVITAVILGGLPTASAAVGPGTDRAAVVPAGQARTAADETIIDTSQWPIHNRANSGCFEVRSTASDVQVLKVTCNLESTRQYWGLQYAGTGDYYQVKNKYSGKCLVVRGTANEAVAVQSTCGNFSDQHWLIQQDASSKNFRLKSRSSGKCLVMRGSQANARQYTCGNQYLDQLWQRGMPTVAEFTPYLRKPVYLVHGYSDTGEGLNINGSYFDGTISSLKDCSAASNRGVLCHNGLLARTWSFCYYTAHTGCDLKVPGDRERPIKDVGRDLAWEIYDHFSKFNVPVDAVGHSMGGLVLQAALTGVANREDDFPPYLYVENAITVATPHGGIPASVLCQFQQCKDMRGDSAFRQWVQPTPRSAIYTIWSLIGSDDDWTVPADRAVPSHITETWLKAIFMGDQILPKQYAHMEILDAVSETKQYLADVCSYDYECDPGDRETFERISTVSPGRMVKEELSGPDW
nr:Ricin-type beta-trefoil lectin domain [uncultured organism]